MIFNVDIRFALSENPEFILIISPEQEAKQSIQSAIKQYINTNTNNQLSYNKTYDIIK